MSGNTHRTRFRTLTEALDRLRSESKRITYITGQDEEREVSYQGLYRRAVGILGHLQRQGIQCGDELVLFLSNNEQFIDVFWACLYGGIVPVPVAPGIADEHRNKLIRILHKLTNPYLYTDLKTLNRLASFTARGERNEPFEHIQRRALRVDDIHDISEPGQTHAVAPGDVAFIQFSSGSTSQPKGVVLTHENILTNIDAIIEGAGFTAQDVSLSWMPLTHDMGLIGFHLNMLVSDMNQCLMPTDLFIRRPLLWLQKASQKHVSILCSPNFGYKHLLKVFSEEKMQGVDLSRVRLIFNGAEPISVHLCEAFLSRLAPFGLQRNAMFTVYGLAEASLAVSFPDHGQEYRALEADRNSLDVGGQVRLAQGSGIDRVSFASVGRPVKDCQVRIATDCDHELGPLRVGHIHIRGANVTKGYFRDEQTNAAAFHADGWLDTGDLGFMTDDGELVITGRAKDIIFANGQNYYPHDLEGIAQHADRLELGKVAVAGFRPSDADTDELLVFVLFRGSTQSFLPIASQVARLINEQVGLEVTHVIPVKRIPKTTSGKVQRHVLVEDYASGAYRDVLNELQQLKAGSTQDWGVRTEIERTLQAICDQAITDNSVGVHDNLFELGTSSLVLVQIHEGIEEAFPGQVDITDLLDYPTIADLAAYLETKTTNAPFSSEMNR